MSIANKILLTAALIIATTFSSFSAYNYSQQRDSIEQGLSNYMAEMGTSTSLGIQDWISGKILRLDSLAEDIEVTNEKVYLQPMLRRKSLQNNFLFTYIGDTEGKFNQEPWEDMPSGYDARTRPWYTSAVQSGRTILTEPYVDSSTGQLVITVAAPLYRQDGALRGVVGGDLSLDTIVKKINTLNFNKKGFAFLVDVSGKIIVHPDSTLIGKTIEEIYPIDTPALSSAPSEVNYNGSQQLITFTPISTLPSAQWYIGICIDKDEAYFSLSQFKKTAIIVTLIAVCITTGLLGLLISVLMRPIRTMKIAMQEIAAGDGDLTKRLDFNRQDELGELAQSFNRFVDRIHGSIRQVSAATDQLTNVARQVTEASNTSMKNSDNQAHRTNSVATAITELGAGAFDIASNAAHASEHLSNARLLAKKSQDVVDQTIDTISDLSARIAEAHIEIHNLNHNSTNIGQILDVITSISQQTNLLALNAAIEAARAGEAGSGFAVVADEVRSLAYRTQESAQQVQHLIEELQRGAVLAAELMSDSQAKSDQTVTIANTAGHQLAAMMIRMNEVDSMSHSVAEATREQTAVVDSIHINITEIDALNQKGVNNLQLTLDACTELETQVLVLKEMVCGFRV